ncbi:MAG: hypothetical protein ACOC85_03950 [Thermoplasmatota archaeon]
MSDILTVPFEVTGMTSEEQEEHDLFVERSFGSLTKQVIEEKPPTGVLKVFLNWIELQEEEYIYSKSLVENELWKRGEL